MFCPECEAEYREGFLECADCRVALVESVAHRKASDRPQGGAQHPAEQFELVTVLTTADPGKIALVKSLLNAHDIDHIAFGEYRAGLSPPLLGGFRLVDPVRFQVRREDAERATELLLELA